MRNLSLMLAVAGCGLCLGCGNTASSSNSTSKSAPSTTPPTITNANAFQAAMLDITNQFTSAGEVIVNPTADNGQGNLQLQGATAMAGYTLQFCPFPSESNPCFAVASLTADASGKISANFQFPQQGSFSGIFNIVQGNTILWSSGFESAANLKAVEYRAAWMRAGALTQDLNGLGGGTDPIKAGFLTVGQTLHAEAQGIRPFDKYTAVYCGITASSSCLQAFSFTTDELGNGTVDVSSASVFGTINQPGIFRLANESGNQFFAGFVVQ